MKSGWFEELRSFLIKLIPLQTFFLCLFASPDHLLIGSSFPALHHGIFYYWCVFRPESMYLGTLLIGSLAFDAFVGQRLGETFLEFFLFMLGILSQRKYLLRAPFVVVWAFFVFSMAVFVAFSLVTYYTWGGAFVALDLLRSLMWVSISYPLISFGLDKMARLFSYTYA